MPKRPTRPPVSVREPLTKAEILRRGMRSFAREQGGVSPMLRLVADSAVRERPQTVAEKHDEILADSYRPASKKRR